MLSHLLISPPCHRDLSHGFSWPQVSSHICSSSLPQIRSIRYHIRLQVYQQALLLGRTSFGGFTAQVDGTQHWMRAKRLMISGLVTLSYYFMLISKRFLFSPAGQARSLELINILWNREGQCGQWVFWDGEVKSSAHYHGPVVKHPVELFDG